jgi:hypothetical protein
VVFPGALSGLLALSWISPEAASGNAKKPFQGLFSALGRILPKVRPFAKALDFPRAKEAPQIL